MCHAREAGESLEEVAWASYAHSMLVTTEPASQPRSHDRRRGPAKEARGHGASGGSVAGCLPAFVDAGVGALDTYGTERDARAVTVTRLGGDGRRRDQEGVTDTAGPGGDGQSVKPPR